MDLTECGITCLENLQYFPHLETLVLDKNHLIDLTRVRCPTLPHLTTLWCNNNDIQQLPTFLAHVTMRFPQLRYLSMMENPVVPSSDEGEELMIVGEVRLVDGGRGTPERSRLGMGMGVSGLGTGLGLGLEPDVGLEPGQGSDLGPVPRPGQGLEPGQGLGLGSGLGMGMGSPRSPSSAAHTIHIRRSPPMSHRGNHVPPSGIATPPTLSSQSSSPRISPRSSPRSTHTSSIRNNQIHNNQPSSTTTTPTRPSQPSQSNLSHPSQISQTNDRGHETLEDWSIADFAPFVDENSQHTLSSGITLSKKYYMFIPGLLLYRTNTCLAYAYYREVETSSLSLSPQSLTYTTQTHKLTHSFSRKQRPMRGAFSHDGGNM